MVIFFSGAWNIVWPWKPIKSISDFDLITKNADKLARKYLENAKIDISNKESFYSSLDQALFNFFKSKYMIRKEDFSKDQ